MCYLCTCLTHINIHIFLSVFLINDMFWWCVHAATTAAVRPMRLWTCLKVVVVRRQRATLAPAPNTTNVSSYFFFVFSILYIRTRVCVVNKCVRAKTLAHTHTPTRVALIYSTCARLYFNGGQHKVAYTGTHTHTNVIEIDLKAWTKV